MPLSNEALAAILSLKGDLVGGKHSATQSRGSSLSYSVQGNTITLVDASNATSSVTLPIADLLRGVSFSQASQVLTFTALDGTTTSVSLASFNGGPGFSHPWVGKSVALIGDSRTGFDLWSDQFDSLLQGDLTTLQVDTGSLTSSSTQGPLDLYDQVALVPPEAQLVVIDAGSADFTGGADIGTISDTTTATWHGAINRTLTDLFAVRPDRVVVFLLPFGNSDGDADGTWETDNPEGDALTDFYEAAIQQCRRCGAYAIDPGKAMLGGLTGAAYTEDGLRLNEAGASHMAAFVWQELAGVIPPSAGDAARVVTPVFSRATGIIPAETYVTISTPTAGAVIYYTLDGSAPTTSSLVYTEALFIIDTTTVRALAVRAGLADSLVATASYIVSAPAALPTFSPAASAVAAGTLVALSTTTDGAFLYYTLDGSTPTVNSTRYSGPIVISPTTTIKAVAAVPAGLLSGVASATYSLLPQATIPLILPAAGSYAAGTQVTITTTTPGVDIYYTIDGSTPTTASLFYTGSVILNGSVTIRAIAAGPGFRTSPVAAVTYATPSTTAAPLIAVLTSASTLGSNLSVVLSTTTPNATIRYTLDGSTPTAASPTYTGLLSLAGGVVVKALATSSGRVDSGVTTFTVPARTASVTFSLSSSAVVAGTTVTLASSTAGSVIYYTLDGSTPSTASFRYSSPVEITDAVTITAVATSTGRADSAVTAATYTIVVRAVAPSFSPSAGVVAPSTPVTITSPTMTPAGNNAAIYYTTNGSTPTTDSTLYTVPVVVSPGTTLKAIAVRNNFDDSLVSTAAYVSSLPVVVTPAFSPSGGGVAASTPVSITTSTAGATTYYTTNGSTPTTSSTVYNPSSPVLVSPGITLKALAVASGFTNSAVGTAVYVAVGAGVVTPVFSPTPQAITACDTVTISTTTPSADIYYTLNGGTPTSASTLYTAPVAASGLTLKAIAIKSGLADSAVVTGNYTALTPTTPAFSVTGEVAPATPVTITTSPGSAAIYYTINGATPTVSSTLYAGPVNVSPGDTLRAIAAFTPSCPTAVSSVATAVYTALPPTTASPVFSPAPSTITTTTSVTMSSATSGATIRYTLDGTSPTSTSTLYTSAISVPPGTFIRAIAFKAGSADSTVTTGVYAINSGRAATPLLVPAGGVVSSGTPVTIVSATAATYQLRYTLNGTTPTGSSTLYDPLTPVTVGPGTTLKVIATKAGLTNSFAATGIYTASSNQVATPIILPPAGLYYVDYYVTISCATPGAVIHYTVDGSEPTAASPVYVDDPEAIVHYGGTIKAIAIKAGMTNSAVATNVYTVAAIPLVTFSPPAGGIIPGQLVTLSHVLTGNIYYRRILPDTGGGEPDWLLYSTPFAVEPGEVWEAYIDAYAAASFWTSAVATAAYTAAPMANPVIWFTYSGDLNAAQCRLAVTDVDFEIYYTTDGSTPTPGSGTTDRWPPPFDFFTVTPGQVVKAITTDNSTGRPSSSVVSRTYVVPLVPTPVFTPTGGAQANGTSVTISVPLPETGPYSYWTGSEVFNLYVTTDGSPPNLSGATHSGTVTLTTSVTIKAQAKEATPRALPSTIAETSYTISQLDPPTFSEPAGSVLPGSTVALLHPVSGVTIRYTTNGTTPNGSSPVYSTPITITTATTIKAYAIKAGSADSTVATAAYSIAVEVGEPYFSPPAGAIVTNTPVAILSNTVDAVIYYTVDGTEPTTSSLLYTDRVSISPTTNSPALLRAIATRDGLPNSSPTSATYTLAVVVARPTFSPAPGAAFTTPFFVAITCSTPGATIYYTTDGSAPDRFSTRYTFSVALSSSVNIRAVAYVGDNVSPLASASYSQLVARQPTISPPAGETIPSGGVTVTLTQASALVGGSSVVSPMYAIGAGPFVPYRGPFTVSSGDTVTAIGTEVGCADSAPVSVTYLPTTATPTFSPNDLLVDLVSDSARALACATPSAVIYYTLDNTNPTTASPTYSTPLALFAPPSQLFTVTLRAVALAPGLLPSVPLVVTFARDVPLEEPTIAPASGLSLRSVPVQVQQPPNAQARLHVTVTSTDSNAVETVTEYDEPVTTFETTVPVPTGGDTTVEAYAYRGTFANNIVTAIQESTTASATFTYGNPAPVQTVLPVRYLPEAGTIEVAAIIGSSLSVTVNNAAWYDSNTSTSHPATSNTYELVSPATVNIEPNASSTMLVRQRLPGGDLSDQTYAFYYGLYSPVAPAVSSAGNPPAGVAGYLSEMPVADDTRVFLDTLTSPRSLRLNVEDADGQYAPEIYIQRANPTEYYDEPFEQLDYEYVKATYYTLNGSTPTTSSLLYSSDEAVLVSPGDTIKAISVYTCVGQPTLTSAVTIVDFTVLPGPPAAAPVISPSNGVLPNDLRATITSSVPGAVIKYNTRISTSGSIDAPNFDQNWSADEAYSGFAVLPDAPNLGSNLTGQVRICAYVEADSPDYSRSPTVCQVYNKQVWAVAPTISPAGGTVSGSVTVTISNAGAGGQAGAIRYTLDGSTPNMASTVYVSPLSVSPGTTVRAISAPPGFFPSPVAIQSYTAVPTVSPPVFSVAAGPIAPMTAVAISVATAGSQVYYTTNGATPTTSSTLYTLPPVLSGGQTLKAIAVKAGLADSAVVTAVYTELQADPPVLRRAASSTVVEPSTPAVEAIPDTAYIHLATQVNTNARYTLNGATPTVFSTLYLLPVAVSPGQTLRAISSGSGYVTSNESRLTFTTLPTVATPAIVASDITSVSVAATVTCATPTATLRYTLDGSEPSPSSPLVAGVISLDPFQLLRVRGYRTDYLPSAVASFTYDDIRVPTPVLSPSITLGTATVAGQPATVIPREGYVTIDYADQSQAFYTVDGSTPTQSSTLYVAPIVLAGELPMTIRAIAVRPGVPSSAVVSGRFIKDQLSAPVFTPAGPAVSLNATITAESGLLSSGDPADSIRYTIDGSIPTGSSPLLSGFTYTAPVTMRAAAFKTGYPAAVSIASFITRTPTLTVTPAAGTVTSPVTVVLSNGPVQLFDSNPIYYTTNGLNPRGGAGEIAASSAVRYTTPFVVQPGTRVRATAYNYGIQVPLGEDIDVTYADGRQAVFVNTIVAPGASVGQIVLRNTFTLFDTSPGVRSLFYTLDGSDPTGVAGIQLPSLNDSVLAPTGTTIRAALRLANNTFRTPTTTYTVPAAPSPAAPTVLPASVDYSQPFNVSMSGPANAVIRYSTAGYGGPGPSWPIYTTPLAVRDLAALIALGSPLDLDVVAAWTSNTGTHYSPVVRRRYRQTKIETPTASVVLLSGFALQLACPTPGVQLFIQVFRRVGGFVNYVTPANQLTDVYSTPILFSTLTPAGDYRVVVQARDPRLQSSDVLVYDFTVI